MTAQMSLSDIFRRFRRNIAVVVGSRLIFGLLNLATNVLVIQAFGILELGIVVLLQGYVRLFGGIVRVESWQAVLRYGAVLQDQDNQEGLRRLLGFTLGVDVLAMSCAIAAAILFVPYASDIFDWPKQVADFAPLFAISLIFITHATPNGVVRLFDRVDALAWQFASNAVLRFAGVGLTTLLGGDVFHIVLVWFIASIFSGSWVFAVCFRELKKRALLPLFRTNWFRANQEFQRIWRFLWMTNAAGVISLLLNHATTLFIGAQLGAAAAGTYEVARRFSAALSRPTRLLGPLIFPELSKLTAQKDWGMIRSLLFRQIRVTAVILVGVAVLLFPLLPFLVELLFGPELSEHIWLFRFLIIGVMISVLGFTLEPILLSANKPGTVLLISTASVASYVLVAALTISDWPLIGFSLGLIAYYVVYQVLVGIVGLRLLNKRLAQKQATARED